MKRHESSAQWHGFMLTRFAVQIRAFLAGALTIAGRLPSYSFSAVTMAARAEPLRIAHLAHRATRAGSVGETTLTSIGLLGLGLASSVVTARALGPNGRGVFTLATTCGGLALLIAGLGLQQALAVAVAHDPSCGPRAIGLAAWAAAVLGGSSGALCALAVLLAARGSVHASLVTVALTLPAGLVAQHLLGVLQGLQRLHAFNLARLTAPLITTCAIIALAIAGAATAFDAVLAYAAGLAGSCVVTSLSLRDLPLTVPDRAWARHVLRNASLINVGSIAYQANRQLGVVLVAAVGTLRDVGRYGVALGYAGPVAVFSTAIALHALPEVAASSRGQAWRRLAARRIRLAVLATAPLALGMALLAPVLVPLAFGSQYDDSVVVAQWLCGALSLLGIAHVLHEVCRGVGRVALSSTIETLGAVGSLVALMILVPRYGIDGAAAATTGVYTITCVTLGALVAHYGRAR